MENKFIQQMESISIENKYLKWWKNIIISGMSRAANKHDAIALVGYVEGHHIFPRSFGGTDDRDNIVYLTAREHIVVHHLTYKFTTGRYKKRAWVAFCMMVNVDPSNDRQRHTNSRYIALAKEGMRPVWATVQNLSGVTDDVLAGRFNTSVSNVCKWRKVLGVTATPRYGSTEKGGVVCKSTMRSRVWRNANKSRHNQYMRDYRNCSIQEMMEDPDEIWFERDARKRKALIQATPPWVDREYVRRIYQKCVELDQRYPVSGFTVHHIVPISHPRVCGLHVPENLKVMSKSMKQKLGRKFIPS